MYVRRIVVVPFVCQGCVELLGCRRSDLVTGILFVLFIYSKFAKDVWGYLAVGDDGRSDLVTGVPFVFVIYSKFAKDVWSYLAVVDAGISDLGSGIPFVFVIYSRTYCSGLGCRKQGEITYWSPAYLFPHLLCCSLSYLLTYLLPPTYLLTY